MPCCQLRSSPLQCCAGQVSYRTVGLVVESLEQRARCEERPRGLERRIEARIKDDQPGSDRARLQTAELHIFQGRGRLRVTIRSCPRPDRWLHPVESARWRAERQPSPCRSRLCQRFVVPSRLDLEEELTVGRLADREPHCFLLGNPCPGSLLGPVVTEQNSAPRRSRRRRGRSVATSTELACFRLLPVVRGDRKISACTKHR